MCMVFVLCLLCVDEVQVMILLGWPTELVVLGYLFAFQAKENFNILWSFSCPFFSSSSLLNKLKRCHLRRGAGFCPAPGPATLYL